MSALCVTVRFLHPAAHGRADGGEPEWPPSPLRLFQTLVAAAAARWNERQVLDYAVPALRWVEAVGSPDIVAPVGVASEVRTQFYVPDNTADLLVPQFKKGAVDSTPKRTEKVVRPTHLSDEAVHYLYPLTPEGCPHLEVLKAAARSVTHLGWGIDMVAADATVISQDDADKLSGHRWRTVPAGGVSLRVPKAGTLADLMRKHEAFLGRLSADGFKPVPPLSCFDVKQYHSPTAGVGEAPVRPFAAFQILAPDASKVRAFGTARGVRDVAAWVRYATSGVCAGWPFGDVAGFVHGHDPSDSKKPLKGESADARFSYLPLPSIERRGDRGEHVASIRRVIVAAPPGFRERVDWVRRRLTGQELMRPDRPDEPVGLLNLLPTSDWVLRQYTGAAEVWSTVTPVLLPGYDDRDPAKAEGLLMDAFRHAGYPSETVVCEELAWRPVGFRAGVDLAGRYERPDNLKRFPAYHVRVRFRQPVTGPLAVGAGRYRGFGLFAKDG
jgi:CRISPR-associated protein Csb2